MTKRWLILDCNFLVWRAHHGTGHLRGPRDQSPSGAVFGFFRAVPELQQRFAATGIVFCFDHGKSHRYDLCDTYKKRKPDDDAEKRKLINRQIDRLKLKYLKRVGYKNVFFEDRYEADDIIASVVNTVLTKSDKDQCYIVSADKDLFQLLDCGLTYGPRVFIFNPTTKVCHDRKSFEDTFGVNPTHWRTVKALAGCSTDKVPGVPGVGEATAIKFLTKGIAGKKGKDIVAALHDKKWMRRQYKLVGIPFPGCPKFKLKNKGSTVDPAAYNRLMDKLGFQSLKEQHRG